MDLPPEYVLHLLPLMAVCGLPPPNSDSLSPTAGRTERSGSLDKLSLSSPTPLLASFPYIEPELGREILRIIDQWRTLALWEPFASKDGQIPGASPEGIFRVLAVDRSFRLPPQKARPHSDVGVEGVKELHSPLSPFTPDSPLYPDGIMTTMWIRKHRDIIPAIFVSFYEMKSEERPHNIPDEELARHLADLRKSFADRGVKLCAVLTGPWRADDISTRLDYLRRNSTLDSKTGLFYLPPPPNEAALQEFFKNLRQSQYPFAIEHYRLRFNKTKRRRPKIPPAEPNMPAPLDAKGWSVRINYKLAAYSEYRQELDVAIKYYELAYNELIDLFSSTAILPPRSKRWGEARVLADSIFYKLCKLHLYLGDHLRVIQTFNSHNKRWSTLLNGWGLGVETAEYWNWLSRNHRIFAELLDISEAVIVGENEIENAIKLVTGDAILSVDSVLHHSGYYYLVAVNCIRQEHARMSSRPLSDDNTEDSVDQDLNNRMFENLTLSAEYFIKRGHRRTAAYVELARCKSRQFAGQYSVVMDLLPPLIQIYRSERWYGILAEALMLGLDAAKQTNDRESEIQFSLELLADEFSLSAGQLDFNDLNFLAPSSENSMNPSEGKEVIIIGVDEFVSFLKPSFAFQTKTAYAGTPVAFQLSLKSNARSSNPITFTSLGMIFNEQIPEIHVKHAPRDHSGLQKIDASEGQGVADLSMSSGKTKYLEFAFTPIGEALIEACRFGFNADIDIIPYVDFGNRATYPHIDISKLSGTTVPRTVWHRSPKSLTVHPKPPKVGLSTSLKGPAYTGEKLPIIITLENGESETVSLNIQFEVPDIEDVEPDTPSLRDMFVWQDPLKTAVAGNTLEIGNVTPGQRKECVLLFNAPIEPTEHSLSLIIKYFLQSDPKTEVVKRALLDVPVIQPLQTTFDIFSQLAPQGGMPNIFSNEKQPLRVSQSWRLISSVSRIGSDLFELREVRVIGECNTQNVSLDLAEENGPDLVLDTLSHHAETNLTLTRPIDTEIAEYLHLNLSIVWRRQSSTQNYDWNQLIVLVPELTFIPFAPRILADVTPHPDALDLPPYLSTYTIENPTMDVLSLDILIESSDDCAFSGPKQIRVTLLPFTSYDMKVVILPLAEEGLEWTRLPRVTAVDEERKRVLEVLRVRDYLKMEGPDLYLRMPHTI